MNILLIILYGLPLFAIWSFDYLPMQDYPLHLATTKVIKHYDSFAQGHFSVSFFKGLSPIPNVAFELFATNVCTFCGVDTAGRLFISSYVLLFVFSLYLLCREMKANYLDTLVMALPLVYSTYFYMGFLNFIFSIPMFLLSVWSYQCSKRNKGYLVFLGIGSNLLYLSHLFSFAFFLFFIFIDSIITIRRLSGRFVSMVAASISIPLLFFINFVLSTSGHSVHYLDVLDKIKLLAFPFVSFSVSLGFAMLFFYICALFFIFRGTLEINRSFLVMAVLYLAIYFFLPFGSIEGSYVDVRAFAFGMVMLLFSVRLDRNIYKNIAFTLIIIASLISTLLAWYSFSKFNKEISPAIPCLKQMEDGSRMLPVGGWRHGSFLMDSFVEPYAHSWGYAFLGKDFMTPYFPGTVHHILKYKVVPYTPYIPGLMNEKKLGEVKRQFDYIAIFGDNPVESGISRIGAKICEGSVMRLYKVNK